jgi:AraC-like DNA-binding protein
MLPMPVSSALSSDKPSQLASVTGRKFATSDIEEAIDVVSSIYCDHKVLPCGPVGKIDAELKLAQAGNLPTVTLRYSTPVIIDAGNFPNLFLMMSAAAGAASVDRSHRTAEWRRGQTIPLSPGQDTRLSFDRAFAQSSLRVDVERLEQMCAQWLGHPLDRPLSFALQPLSDAFEPVWQNAMQMTVGLTHSSSDVPLNAVESLEEFLYSLILHWHPHNYSDELAGRAQASTPRVVAEAKQIFLERAASRTTVSDVAKELGVSLRSLQEGFRKSEDTTPFAFLRNARLDAARRILSEPTSSASVSDVALDLGFTHLGRFSSAYKTAFGETPINTLRRHKVSRPSV